MGFALAGEMTSIAVPSRSTSLIQLEHFLYEVRRGRYQQNLPNVLGAA